MSTSTSEIKVVLEHCQKFISCFAIVEEEGEVGGEIGGTEDYVFGQFASQ